MSDTREARAPDARCVRGRFERFASSGTKLALPLLAASIWLVGPSRASAGGYDTPMLYSARHMGMGGTAVSYVDDASALFHNPAGIGRIADANLHLDLTALMGHAQGSPSAAPSANSIESNTTFAPFFLAGGAYRFHKYLVGGLAAYPVASAGATYEYDVMGTNVEDRTRLLFYEVAPALAVSIPQIRLTLGATWRITVVRLDREVSSPETNLVLRGANYKGFRVGAQWEAIENHLRVGFHYRHKTVTDVADIEPPVVSGIGVDYAKTSFTLPSRISFGIDGGNGPYRVAVDVEYALNSENVRSVLDVGFLTRQNIFGWQNAVTLRVGAEYTVAERFPIRIGYVFDATTSNISYPTAFGTPPAPTHVLTAGAGIQKGGLRANFAIAQRFGSTTVTAQDIANGDLGTCDLCGAPGDYAIRLTGFYFDVSYDFGRRFGREAHAQRAEPATPAPPQEPAPEAAPAPDAAPATSPGPEASAPSTSAEPSAPAPMP